MSDFDVRKIPPKPEPDDEPIPFDDSEEQQKDVSHSPINLGTDEAEETKAQEKSSAKPREPEAKKDKPVSKNRITGVKTFFTKLHPGAIEFLDEQISEWLQKNPDVVVKRTEMVTGEVQGKKVEPNIIISVWY